MNSRALLILALSSALSSEANNHVNGFQSSLSPLNTHIRGGGFGIGRAKSKNRPSVVAKSSAAVADVSTESTELSWESFEEKFTSDETPAPVLTVYRGELRK